MEIKKTPEVDLENKRVSFFLMGLSVVLSVFYVALEWESEAPDGEGTAAMLAPFFIEDDFGADFPADMGKTLSAVQPPVRPEQQPPAADEDYVIEEAVSAEEQLPTEAVPAAEVSETVFANSAAAYPPPAPPDMQKAEADDEEPEAAPHFPGGYTAFARFVYNHIRYPEEALRKRIEGRVWCSFTVESDGRVSDVALEEGVDILLDREAVRVLETMPLWIPGKSGGKNIKVKVYLPVVFKI
jgi:protein TonB